MTATNGTGPDPETIIHYITDTFDDVDVVELDGTAWVFSIDPEKHWPNFATLVTTDDDYDQSSDLARPGVFRLNIGVGRDTFLRLVGDQADPDYTALDRVIPHPVYAKQRWIGILNPSTESFEAIVKPLLAEAHSRLRRPRR